MSMATIRDIAPPKERLPDAPYTNLGGRWSGGGGQGREEGQVHVEDRAEDGTGAHQGRAPD